jgi:lysophospholipase
MGDGAEPKPAELVLIPGNPPPEGAEVLWYQGKNSKRVRMLYAPEPRTNDVKTRGLAIVCPGRTEFIEKYFEVGRDLQARGFAVAIFDWPGQGLSERQCGNPLLGHVRSYGVYVDALARGLEKIQSRAPKTWVLLAHSMGATVALEAMRTRRLAVKAAAFSSPMWGIPIWFFQRWFARLVRFLGMGGLPARPPGPPETFENNQLTHDRSRWEVYRKLIEAEPKLAVGEPTIGWVVASLNVLRELFEPGALDHLRHLPSLIALATEETIVKKSAQRKLARRFKEGKVLTVQGAGHEILMEADARRAQFWTAFEDMCRRARI